MMISGKYHKSLLTLIFLIAFLSQAAAQVVIERSKEKVIVSGKPYYIHQVKKGETSYSISKAYNITVEELTQENPPAVYGINEGQTLRIPVKEEGSSSQQQPTVRPKKDEKRFIYHRLQPGETVYYLSRLYGVSENEIISVNQGIEINKLAAGAEIAVPRREFMINKQDFADQDQKYIFHKVVRGESLSSIAEKYSLTVRELRRENRDIRFPQVGDYLRIQVVKPAEVQAAEQQKPDSVVIAAPESSILVRRTAEITPVRNLSGTIDVAILLPFYLEDNASRSYIDSSKVVKGRRIPRTVLRPDDWIYPRSLGFTEMYEGILLAADTLRSLGIDIRLHVFDIKNDTVELTRMIRNGTLSVMDLIIGPVYSSNLAIVARYARDLKIPVVSPVPLFSKQILMGNPELFMSVSSLEVAQDALVKKVSEYSDHNFIFIHSDTANVDTNLIRFREKIFAELTSRRPYEEIRFKEFVFYSKSTFNNDSINRLGHTLSDKSGNVIIIASEEAPVISENLMDIHALLKKYDIKVFGYPAMRECLGNLDPKYFFDLDLHLYSPYWIDYSRRDIRKFNSDFQRLFLTQPPEMSYAWQGYDIAYYFISGIAMHGKEFIEHPEIHRPDLLQTDFDFRRKNPEDGFENYKLFFIWYTKEYEVKLINEPEPVQ
jgi:LysM repeat protein